MNKILLPLLMLVLLSGCSFNIEVLTPNPGGNPAPSATAMTPSPIVTSVPPTGTPIPGFTPTGSDPVFYGAYVALTENGSPGQIRFAGGTTQLFAKWNYQNMRAGMTIKREWYLDGLPWLEREEPWDFARYGESGTVSDVSIFDFDAGLPSGTYQLMVYIDGVRQPIGKTTPAGTDGFIEFEILPVIEAQSPNGGWFVRADLNRLILIDTSGGQAEIFTGNEIAAVGWFPDSQHLLVVDRDRSEQMEGFPIGIRDELWLVDISSLETTLLHDSDTGLGVNVGIAVSPDGRYIASSKGSGFGDACFVDIKMAFFELAPDFSSVKEIKQGEFAGLPFTVDGVVYPTGEGMWEGNGQFVVPLGVTCAPDESLNGSYVFDVPNLMAKSR